MLLGAYTDKYYQGYYCFKAQNLRRRLRAAYDNALGEYDLLLMPTTRMMASKIPPADAPLQTLMQHSWEQITNTCPFNITHHPAISIPCGLGEGSRPIGLMLVAKGINFVSGCPRLRARLSLAVDGVERQTLIGLHAVTG